MKRFIMLALVAAFMLSSVCSASAADIKASGQWKVSAQWDTKAFDKDNSTQEMNIMQRVRTSFDFIANENLKGVLQVESGTNTWGDAGSMYGQRDQLNVRQAYLDFNYPGTDINFKIGKQMLSLPHAFNGHPAMGGEPTVAAAVTAPINDMFTVAAGYSRLLQSSTATDTFADMYYVAAPVTLDGVNFAPYFAYVNLGKNVTVNGVQTEATGNGDADRFDGLVGIRANAADDDLSVWWAGTTFEMTMFDPFVVKADLTYGQTSASNDRTETAGWFADAAVSYTGLDFMTPEVFVVYSSGVDDDKTGESDRMPVLDNDWSAGSFFFGGSDLLDGDTASDDQMGFWILGASLKDISFIEKMTHTAHILYAQGNNDHDGITGATNVAYGSTLTDEDSLWEIDFNTKYALYDELTAIVELGYIAADFDKDFWGVNDEDGYKLGLGLIYEF